MSGTTYFNSQSLDGIKDATLSGNLYANNIIMSSNMSTNSGQGNVYFSGNLVVNGNIFSLGGSVGSGSGTSQGVTYTLPSSYSLVSAGGTQPFANGVAAPNISGFNINLNQFAPQAVQAVTSFSASTGMLKFATGGLYQVQCVLVGDQPVAKVGIGSTTSSTFPPTASPTGNYVYVYNFPLNSSPSEVVTIPLTITDTSKWYYLDAYFSNIAGTPTVLYQTAPPSGSAAGSNYGTYVQVSPFGNYLTSATGVASGLLLNCSSTTTLSAPLSSNTFRLAMTSSNGWTVNGVSTSLAVTSGGNFQVSQVGIYEVSMCLNPSVTPMMFGVGSLGSDTAPSTQGPYIYQYAPMYTQDPTTVLSLPLNITDTSKYYYIDVIFPGTQATVTLSNVSTYVALRPVGSYVNPSTNPWSQQGTTVTYNSGLVGIGAGPSGLTETLTVSGNTSFVGNVTVTSDVSGSAYVSGKRVPAGSLSVSNYVTGSVPLTTTTNLIQNYLSNAASVVSTAPTYNPALSLTNTTGTTCNLTAQHSAHYDLTSSNLFVEAWIYLSSIPNNPSFFTIGDASADDIGLYINAASGLQAYISNTTAVTTNSGFVGGASVGLTTWTHVALAWNYNAKTIYAFRNGTASTAGTMSVGTPRYTAARSVYIGDRTPYNGSSTPVGYVYDMRVIRGSTVPGAAGFTAPATPAVFSQTTLPGYLGLTALTGNTIALALQSQYFPGASTAPYGPCLTLPGTVGSYYAESGLTHADWKGTGGFTCEAWVNYASLANSNIFSAAVSIPASLGAFNGGNGNINWSFGALTSGQVGFLWVTAGGTGNAFVTSNTLTTGSWNHIMVQSNGSNVYMAINGNFTTLTAQGFTPTAGNTTIAPTIAPSTSYAVFTNPVNIGQWNGAVGPNFAIAKARLIYGANVYSAGSFTPNPNFAPSATAPFWQLDSQYPLPTYPSIQDVTVVPSQLTSYGSIPTPVGGVTSNVLGPYTSFPQLDSIRFDGTGYIDYGNAASSALCSNLWASPWTIEGWVYINNTTNYHNIVARNTAAGSPYDWSFYVAATTMYPSFIMNSASPITNTGTTAVALNTWTHLAVTWDGSKSNIYVGGVMSNSMSLSTFTYTPSQNFQIGQNNGFYTQGNLADVRVSNVARYTGTSFTVPTAQMPFVTDANTLLLLKSLAGQTGQTLEVQGRGLGSTSLGAGRTVQSYPPAPMSSYLLDTTSNSSVTYGQGKYVASASREDYSNYGWRAFVGGGASFLWQVNAYNANGTYAGSAVTVDTLGNSYAGEWLQIQLPVSVLLSSYTLTNFNVNIATKWAVLGSRDGVNWTLVNSQSGTFWTVLALVNVTFAVNSTQAYNYYRYVIQTSSSPYPAVYQWFLNGTEESLCITSDSKVGVGIANPQRSLEVAGDLVVSGTISGGAGLGSFRNRIINGDMRIAQRGVSASGITGTVATYYTVDRWKITASITGTLNQAQQTLTASDTPYQLGIQYSWRNTVAVGTPSPYYLNLYQGIENINMLDMAHGTPFGSPFTISLWFRSNIPNGSLVPIGLQYYVSTYLTYVTQFTVTNSGGWQYVTLTVPPPSTAQGSTSSSAALNIGIGSVSLSPTSNVNVWQSGATFNSWSGNWMYPWYATAGNYIEFTGVQLEKGTVATPWEQRPYAQELALCQRYYYRIGGDATYQVFGLGSFIGSTTLAQVYIPFPVTMRVGATGANFSNSAVTTFWFGAGSGATCTAINQVGNTESRVGNQIQFTTSSAVTAGTGCIIEANNTTSAFLAFSAEL